MSCSSRPPCDGYRPYPGNLSGMRLDGWTGLDVTRPQAGVLLITLDHPERLNALTVAMKRDLIELLTQVQADDETPRRCAHRRRPGVLLGRLRAPRLHQGAAGQRADDRRRPQRCGVDVQRGQDALRRPSTGPCGRSTSRPSPPSTARPCRAGLSLGPGLRPAVPVDDGARPRQRHVALRPDARRGRPLLARAGARPRRCAGLHAAGPPRRFPQGPPARPRRGGLRAGRAAASGHRAGGDVRGRATAGRCACSSGPISTVPLESDFESALDDIATAAAITDHHSDAAEGAKAFREKRPPKYA